MSASPRTSVIMPVYNTADAVIGAITSVQQQTDPDWELLVMVDASPDDAATRVRAHLAFAPDERVRLVDHPENRGVSAVRNHGLELARGRWIAFLDSDDRLRPNFLSTLHAFAEQSGAQVAMCGHSTVRPDGTQTDRFRDAPGVLTGQEAALRLTADRLSPYVWDKLFAAELIHDPQAPVRFREDLHRAEDAVFAAQALARARRCVAVHTSLYLYAIGESGLTWGKVSPLEESLRLKAALEQALDGFPPTPRTRGGLASSRTLTFLNNAHQALTALAARRAGKKLPNTVSNERLRELVRQCRAHIRWKDLTAGARVNPTVCAAGALLKTAPWVYARLYQRHVRRCYGLG